jgi:hypothetical protein
MTLDGDVIPFSDYVVDLDVEMIGEQILDHGNELGRDRILPDERADIEELGDQVVLRLVAQESGHTVGITIQRGQELNSDILIPRTHAPSPSPSLCGNRLLLMRGYSPRFTIGMQP